MEVRNNEMILNKLKSSAIHLAAIIFAAAALLLFGCCSHAYAAGTIGSTADLEAAFQNGGKYVLTADVHSDNGFTLQRGKTLEIDFKEHSLTTGISDWVTTDEGVSYYRPTYTSSIEVDGGTLILRDATGKGKFSRNNTDVDVYVKNGGTLIVDGIDWHDEYAAKVIGAGSSMIMNSGNIQSYMGVYITDGASMEMKGGTYESTNGLGCSTDATVKVSGGTVDSYRLSGNGRLEISGGTSIERIYFFEGANLPNTASLIISGGKFSQKLGNLIWGKTENGTVNITGGYFAQDPSAWLKGEYIAADSNEFEGYPYKVIRQEPPAPVIVPPTNDDPEGTVFNLLQARAGKITKTSVQIVWKKVPAAKKYVVYGNKCGTKNKYKKLTETTKTTLTYKTVAGKKVRKGTYYKFLVYALDANGKVISTSKTVHVATTGGKVGNDKKVTTAAKKGKVTVKKGSKFKLKAKAVPASKKLKVHRHRKMAYETTNKKIATVSSKGVIKGKSKGVCYVYAYTQNGVFAKVKVTVK